MADYQLEAETPFEGYSKNFSNVSLRAITDKAVVSIAVSNDNSKAIGKALKTKMPSMGTFVSIQFSDGKLLAIEPQQMLVLFDNDSDDSIEAIAKQLPKTVCLNDLSDSFVMFEISGPNARKALERICAIDLHPNHFAPGALARTKMEHMATTIICEKTDTYLLMSARSSGPSFAHAIETSIHNTNT